MYNLNELKIRILLFLYQNPCSTTTTIAKHLFENNNIEEIRNNDRLIRYHLNKMIEDGVVLKEYKDGKQYFRVNEKNVFFGLGKLDIFTFDEKEISIGLGEVLVCKVEDGIIIEPITI
jgi:hypothetical protein